MASLNVWMNGELVGEWTTSRTGTPILRYAESWTRSSHARALSLSLPITSDREIRETSSTTTSTISSRTIPISAAAFEIGTDSNRPMPSTCWRKSVATVWVQFNCCPPIKRPRAGTRSTLRHSPRQM